MQNLNRMIHKTKSDLAGKNVRIKDGVKHPQYSDFGGSEIVIEDWWDRLVGQSWGECQGNPACIIYAVRTGLNDSNAPSDDEVLYGHRADGRGSLVHISELEIKES